MKAQRDLGVTCEFTQDHTEKQPMHHRVCTQTRNRSLLLTLELTFPVCLVHNESPVASSVGSLFITAYTIFSGSTGGAVTGRV